MREPENGGKSLHIAGDPLAGDQEVFRMAKRFAGSLYCRIYYEFVGRSG